MIETLLISCAKKMLTQKVLERLIFTLLEYAAQSTDNKLDDKIVAQVKAAMQ